MIHYEHFSTVSVIRTHQQNAGQNHDINIPNKLFEKKGEKLKYLDMTLSSRSNRHEGIGLQLV
jgi:hypothetical protein